MFKASFMAANPPYSFESNDVLKLAVKDGLCGALTV